MFLSSWSLHSFQVSQCEAMMKWWKIYQQKVRIRQLVYSIFCKDDRFQSGILSACMFWHSVGINLSLNRQDWLRVNVCRNFCRLKFAENNVNQIFSPIICSHSLLMLIPSSESWKKVFRQDGTSSPKSLWTVPWIFWRQHSNCSITTHVYSTDELLNVWSKIFCFCWCSSLREPGLQQILKKRID